ncbi:FadR/GntR family transcriptional regulator [Paucibacter sp. O1-1]|nr:FadR family transcriptional regulator [Paucibacter sp. O1-1]MDA3825063.1 FadR/GntR family transcriptional regulator [Paucibacter sp. O1-1]
MPQRLYEAISKDIRQGLYPVGGRLPVEAGLCEHYGVSRTVLRETVARLKADGLIDTQQGRGTFVLALAVQPSFKFSPGAFDSAQAIIDLAELRLGVEGTAAALAARRRTPAQLARLKACLDRMEYSLRDGTSGAEADLEFHQTIAEATCNGHYRLFMDYLQKFYAEAIGAARARSAQARGLSRRAQDEHRAVYEAIAAGDPEAAERAIKDHIGAAAARVSVQDVRTGAA